MRQITQQELDTRVAEHELWWRSHKTSGSALDARELTMTGLSLANRNLVESAWASVVGQGLNLSNASFTRSKFRNISFRASRMVEATFDECDMDGVDFSDSDMAGADLSLQFGAKSRRLILKDVNMTGGFICKTWIFDSNFDGINLNGANLLKTWFENCSFKNANFSNANLMKVAFANSDLRGADFAGARALSTQFDRVRVHGVKGKMTAGRPDLEEGNWIYGKEIDVTPEGEAQYGSDIDVLRAVLVSGRRIDDQGRFRA